MNSATYTYSATLLLDPSNVPDGTYKINLSTGAFVDSKSNIAPTPTGYSGFTLTVVNPVPTVTLTDTDADNTITYSDTVTITAAFSRAMTATPTITISGVVTNVAMTPISGTNSFTYTWDTSLGTLTNGTYTATVSGTDTANQAYSGTDSITFTIADSPVPVIETESDLGKDVNFDGDTSDQVCIISTLDNLYWISEQVSKTANWSEGKIFLQTEDIDASETKYWDDADDDSDGNPYNDPNDATAAGNNEGWWPIGTNISNGFEGFYNGDYHRIIGLNINRSLIDDAGLFSKIEPSVGSAGLVKLGLIDANYVVTTNNNDVGGIIGRYWPKSGNTFDEVFFEGKIESKSTNGYIAGLIGYFFATSGNGAVTNSYTNVELVGGGNKIGGLFGRQSSGESNNVYSIGSFDPNGLSFNSFGGLVANSIDNTFDYTLEKGYAAYDIKATGSSDAYTIVGDDNGSYSGFFTDLYYDSDLTSKLE